MNGILKEIHAFHYCNFPYSKLKIRKLIRIAKEEIDIDASISKLSFSKGDVKFNLNFKKNRKKSFFFKF
jgi:hypothetical protein